MPPRKSTSLTAQQAGFKSALRANAALIPVRSNITAKTAQQNSSKTLNESAQTVANNMKRKLSFDVPSVEQAENSEIMGQVVTIVEHLKQMEAPVRCEVLHNHINRPVDGPLKAYLESFERLKYDEKEDTFEYINFRGIKTKEALLQYVKELSLNGCMKGLDITDVKEGWSGALDALNELEEEREVFVVRVGKQKRKTVWYNNKTPDLPNLDEELIKLWASIRVPEPSTLPRLLADAGLKAAGVDPTTVKINRSSIGGLREQKKPMKRKRALRSGMYTSNKHIEHLMNDYASVGSQKRYI